MLGAFEAVTVKRHLARTSTIQRQDSQISSTIAPPSSKVFAGESSLSNPAAL